MAPPSSSSSSAHPSSRRPATGAPSKGKANVKAERALPTQWTFRIGVVVLCLVAVVVVGVLVLNGAHHVLVLSNTGHLHHHNTHSHHSNAHPPLANTQKSSLADLNTVIHVPDVILFWTTPASTFQSRNLLVLESYLHHHPQAHVAVYATHLTPDHFGDLIKTGGYDVEVVRLNETLLSTISQECPGREWLAEGEWRKGKYYYSHLTDFLRFCLLFAKGGIYSDFDAILLNPLPTTPNFIGKDEAGLNRGCPWCFAGGTGYLAPGLMAAERGSLLAKEALAIGFKAGYDPEVFNLVGPQAVTKAYKAHPDSTTVFDSHVFYPFKYWEVETLFRGDIEAGHANVNQGRERVDAALVLRKLQRRSLSLHLYGHVSSRLPIEPNSVVNLVNRTVSLTSRTGSWEISGPDFVGIRESLQRISSIRLLLPAPAGAPPSPQKYHLAVSVDWGTVGVAGRDLTPLAKSLTFEEGSTKMINARLANLAFQRPDSEHGYTGRAKLAVKITICEEKSERICQELVREVVLLDITALVTVITKTLDRVEKVFHLVRSVHQFYPDVRLLVADDGAEAQRQASGEKRGFTYHVLPFDSGLSAGRNYLVEKVTTEFFITVDDDFTFDEDSSIEDLLWQIETGQCDLVAGKNPHDEKRYGFEFMGLINVTEEELRLEPGSHGSWGGGCHRVDIVPNLFVARTELIRKQLEWDSRLKLGEHEDFFLRAKSLGVKVCSCNTASFMHHPANWGQKKTAYDAMRNRIYEFWKISLMKHGLKRLHSFGSLMIDISTPKPPSTAWVSEVLGTSCTLNWEVHPGVTRSRIMVREAGQKDDRTLVLGGQSAKEAETITTTDTSVVPTGLRSGTRYSFIIYAGNHFEFEKAGLEIQVETLPSSTAEGLLFNGGFEKGTAGWNYSVGTIFSTIGERFHGGELCGRINVPKSNYQSSAPTLMEITQKVRLSRRVAGFVVAGHSMVEQLFGNGGDIVYEFGVVVHFADGTKFSAAKSFSPHVAGWQFRAFTVHLTQFVAVESVVFRCALTSLRGSVYYDDLRLVPLR